MSEMLPGTEVALRGLRWEVVFAQPSGQQHLYRLRCLESALRGHELDVLVPFEQPQVVTAQLDPVRAARLQEWRVFHDAFLLEQALGPGALLAVQPGRLRIEAYQLVPVLRALRMARPRLLLADDVGLGKTIEAGLVLAELIARRRAHRILIVAPAGPLLLQWHKEMRTRFGLRFSILDDDALKEIRYKNELGSNPFDHEALGLISIDYAKQEKVLKDIERTQFDVVVMDEAHHCVRLGQAGDRDDSLRRRLAEVLAQRADAFLLLTATPHDGFDPHFASLVELLDPSLLDGRGGLREHRYEAHVVRRLKRHIKDPQTGQLMFRERQVIPFAVRFDSKKDPDFASFQEAFLTLVAPELRRALRRRAYGDVLAFISLLKRSVSTAAACANTLAAVARRLDDLAKRGDEGQEERRQRIRTLRELERRRERSGSLSFEEEEDKAQLEAEDIAAELAETGAEELREKLGLLRKEVRREQDRLGRIKATRDALLKLEALARKAEPHDPKLAALLDAVKAIRATEPTANVLIYTEYADSQKAAMAYLDAARGRNEIAGNILSILGEDIEKDRSKVTDRFTNEDNLILISTDASAEGLNLHAHCHHLLHIELPYNPNRLEQRNGRIDRFGQRFDPEVRYLYLSGTFEERLLIRLIVKYEAQRKRLGFVPNTLGVTAATEMGSKKLLEGLVEDEGALFKASPKLGPADNFADEVESKAYQDMLAEVDSVFANFEKTSKSNVWLGDAGLAADPQLLAQADLARRRGRTQGAVDLLDFVLDAVRIDSPDADAAEKTVEGIWQLKLPPAWAAGLDDIPGYDPDHRVLRITTNLDQTEDAEGRPVGYLGRAHPLVRRALDRVRHIQLGSGGEVLDRRVAAAMADGPRPGLLYTYLGRLQSGVGREFERVIAVRLVKGEAPEVLMDHADWAPMVAQDRAVSAAGVWETHFASWATTQSSVSEQAAEKAFQSVAQIFSKEHEQDLAESRASLDDWLKGRARDLMGEPERQVGLFGQDGGVQPRWKVLTDPAERLAALTNDVAEAPRRRTEARSTLHLYAQRADELVRRGRMDPPQLSPLGLVLLVPTKGRG